ncbi:MAG: protein kinase domain-containing protein [Burkholderiaceae bacterium]|jgi:serine/threonine protein kinase
MSAVQQPARNGARRVGRFEIKGELGRGAQATVWLAYDPRLQREVAVKVINPDADAASVAQWLDEARAVSRLAHPNVVPVFEADQDGAVSFMVFEYVKGPTLTDLLRKRGKLPEREAATLMRDVLDAVATAHAQGIVHRDLKPSNILLDAQGRPRVMDFGIAARVADAHDGRIAGTPGYISPEAINGAKPHPLMDVFAAGMMLGQMICGRPLRVERDPYRMLERTRDEDVAWPPEMVDARTGKDPTDDALRALVMRAVARDPSRRPESAAAFRNALHEWLDPAPVGAEGGDRATLEFLLRRMRHKSDFPALSDAVVRIQRVTQSENASIAGVTDEIVRDVALTNKLLRMVNTVHFRNAGAGSIASVSRAVSLVGLAGIRSMALSLVLLEHMQDKAHVGRLKELFLQAMMAGTLCDELTPTAKAHDEPFLAGMMSQLGRMLTEFYFPEEATLIRRRVEPAWQRGEWSQAIEDRAVGEVLGLSYEQLGVGVTKVWGLPDSLRRAIARPEGEAPARPVDNAADRLRWCVQASSEIALALMQTPADQAAGKIAAIGERYARALNLPKDQFESAVRGAQSHLQSMSAGLGIDLKADSQARRLMPADLEVPTGNVNPATIVTNVGPATAPDDKTIVAASGERPGAPAPQQVAVNVAPDSADRMLALENGISSVTSALAGDSFKLNEVLRTILQTMHAALGFRCVIFGLRDPKTGVITGRVGLGGPAAALSAQFRVDVNPNGPVDLLSVACKKAADTLISDASADNVRTRLPTWLQRDADARSFVLLPMTMKSAPFALIYADCATAGGIVLGERELSLLRTLRNQAVMAFKTAG